METNSYKNIQILFQKYRRGELSPKEWKVFNQLISCHTDEDLERIFRDEWREFKDNSSIDVALKNKMFAVIERKTRKSILLTWRKRVLPIAASIAIITLLGLTGHLYTNNCDMTALGEHNIIVKTDKGERGTITLPDGTSVRLNSESELTYQQNFGLKERKVYLKGEGFFDVVKQKDKAFTVNTKFININVLGTAFNVYTYENTDSVEMTLVRGLVKVSTVNPPYQTVNVVPNEKVVYNKKTGKMHIQSSENQIETAWIKSALSFCSTSLKDVLGKVGRKYGFTFEIKDKKMLEDLYTGVFDEADINEVMEILSIHFNFEYQIKGNKIRINEKRK